MRVFAQKHNETQQTKSSQSTIPNRTNALQNHDVNLPSVQPESSSHVTGISSSWDFSRIPVFAPGVNVESEMKGLNGHGSPLPKSQRTFFESTFGHDFKAVRIHSDSRSADLARIINARAFTLGQDIVFGTGEYRPESRDGARLLAHELAHVVQQSATQPTIQRQPVTKPAPNDPFAQGGTYEQLQILREAGTLPFAEYEAIEAFVRWKLE